MPAPLLRYRRIGKHCQRTVVILAEALQLAFEPPARLLLTEHATLHSDALPEDLLPISAPSEFQPRTSNIYVNHNGSADIHGTAPISFLFDV